MMSLRDWVNFDWYELENNKQTEVNGYVVWSNSDNLVKIASSHGAVLDNGDQCVTFSGQGWQRRFNDFIHSGPQSVLEQCCVAELRKDGRFEPWESIRLPEMTQRVEHEWFLKVVEEGGVKSVFQPIWDMEKNSVYGFEALARGLSLDGVVNGWQLVEAARALEAMDLFDSQARLAALGGARDQLFKGEKLFINIVPTWNDRVAQSFTQTWDAASAGGFEPEQIVFEVIESEELPSHDQLARVVGHLRSRGSLVALDDFGAGHSSIYVLEQIRPDIVKFDRQLLSGEVTVAKERLLKSLVRYAHDLGMTTVAEGVETIDQLAVVEQCGFDYAQGWLIGRPEEFMIRPEAAVLVP